MKLFLARTSIMNRIRVQFATFTLVTIFVIGIAVFYNWRISINETIFRLQEESSRTIEFAVEQYIKTPVSLNKIGYNLIAKNIFNIEHEQQQVKFFPSILEAADMNIYSFSYGLANGDYFGARRLADGKVQFMLANAQTKGKSQYYNLDANYNRGEIALTLGVFDPRSRDWYQMVEEKRTATFSNVYKHFVLDDLAITAAHPVYNDIGELKGVLGTHIALSQINEYLSQISQETGAKAYIVERTSGEVVGNSVGKNNFFKDEHGVFHRLKIVGLLGPELANVYENYKGQHTNYALASVNGEKLHIKFTPFTKYGLDWLIITIIPESPYVKYMYSSMWSAIFLTAVIVILPILIWTKSIKKALQPIYDLMMITEKFSQGDFSQRALQCKTDEVGKLGSAFNRMADELNVLINNLEQKVAERTLALEQANKQLNTAKAEIELVAQFDFLTGLYNRRFMLAKIEQYILQAEEQGSSFAVVLADIDYFKKVNDTYGHDAGDAVLQGISLTLQNCIREIDYVARWGGEEFLILVVDSSLEATQNLAERVRRRIASTVINYRQNQIAVTISLGVALYRPQVTAGTLIKLADEALYLAKRNGRNRVVTK